MKNESHRRVLDIWNVSDQVERQTLMRQFLVEYGENYSKNDFIRFLAKKYRMPYSDTLPISSRRHEH